ncbi:MAG: HAD family hydrolase [Clostridia bacterium]|nr:HAD family hydrolase [Clostridia bacterium]
MYDWIFFDLDGTLTDPGEGITNSVAHALEQEGVPVPPRAELYRFIGPPLVDSFMRFYGFSEERAHRAVEEYRDYFRDRGIFENQVYDGVPQMLETLRREGKRLCLATSKPEPFAKQILEHFALTSYFEFVAGALMDETRTAKADVIAYALDACGISEPSRVLMVGDRLHDVEGASQNGMDCLGVLFGYGSREELTAAGARYLAENVADIPKWILSI